VEERLQKVLAHAGIASRRICEELIRSGRVKVNGEIILELGTKVNPSECKIEVDGQEICIPEPRVYLLLNKPPGYVSTVFDPQGRPTVLDLVNHISQRIYPVGRLDYYTSGLLLLTNDGALTNNLIHPSKKVKKTYRVMVKGIPSHEKITLLKSGIVLEDGKTAPAQLKILRIENGNTIIDISIHEGRNRQVRRMFEAINHPVLRLERTAFGFLTLGKLKPGQWRYMTSDEVKQLKSLGNSPKSTRKG
jgi:23S rRNA pseudouridine2605 synthase